MFSEVLLFPAQRTFHAVRSLWDINGRSTEVTGGCSHSGLIFSLFRRSRQCRCCCEVFWFGYVTWCGGRLINGLSPNPSPWCRRFFLRFRCRSRVRMQVREPPWVLPFRPSCPLQGGKESLPVPELSSWVQPVVLPLAGG